MTSNLTSIGRLNVAEDLVRFVEDEALPGTGIDSKQFWSSFDGLFETFAARNRALLSERKRLQSKIDDWYKSSKGSTASINQYCDFLRSIDYLRDEPDDFVIETENVDPEIASLAGPQLVVPVMNARYALNAANARWGSLYDALYGTDVISEDDGANASGAYNPVRGAKVIAYGRTFLDQNLPLQGDMKHADIVHYEVDGGTLSAQSQTGKKVGLRDPKACLGFQGDARKPSEILFAHNGLHIILEIDRTHVIGKTDPAGVCDICIEAALTTIMDAEDSVAAVDAEDKVAVYRNWLGLMKGDLEEEIVKNGRVSTRRLADDKTFSAVDGSSLVLPGRSLMLIRNVGLLMTTPAVRLADGSEAPEGLMDAIITSLIALHDLQRDKPINSRAGSVYIVKPKMHGPDEVEFSVETFEYVESALGLPKNTLKIGIMDEERRMSANLKASIHAAKARVAFINTGFLDRTGDEIHTSMEAGPMVRKGDMKSSDWISAYEERNVKIGLDCGFGGRAQIGKGMWAMPDEMAAMMREKTGHLKAGANTAWVPSPTAATLHALHYHAIDVFQEQERLSAQPIPSLHPLMTPPVAREPNWNEKEIKDELSNNAQGILGYIVRWVEHGVGCSKVPDISDIGLMEDRATLRISSQHMANWLHHGICSREQVLEILQQMARKVDSQNAADPDYQAMSRDFDQSVAFKAACASVFEGRDQPSGYTEPLLHRHRLRFKERSNGDYN